MTLSTEGTAEKNKMNSSGAWLRLFEFTYKTEDTVRLCLNNESVTWDGYLWTPGAMVLGDITETKDADVNSITFTIRDYYRKIAPLVDLYKGCDGAEVWIYEVHSDHLDLTEAESENYFEVMGAKVDYETKITFTLGQENLIHRRCPPHRFLKNHCRFKFKSRGCGYTGTETLCSRTLARCKELGNSKNNGGFPGVGYGGFFTS